METPSQRDELDAIANDWYPSGAQAHDRSVPVGFRQFMRGGWEELPIIGLEILGRDRHEERRRRVSEAFRGRLVIIPAGTPKVRSNDCDYPFRPHSDYVYLAGYSESDAVLALVPSGDSHEPLLLLRTRKDYRTDGFFTDRRYGELWTGPMATFAEVQDATGVRVEALESGLPRLRRMFSSVERSSGADDFHVEQMWPSEPPSNRLSQIISDLRLIKDSYEIAVIQRAVDATIIGFDSVASIIRSGEARSERDIEVAFNAEARRYGNAVGYETIVGSGSNATTLHWTRNSGGLRDGTLVLLDAGVEDNEFYTADITRTMPVGGKFMGVQQEVYEIVLSAQEAAIASMGPGASFSDAHESAMDVLASGLISLGILKCSPAEAVDPANQYFRRYALHGTSHMLGLDCHDCSTASLDRYADGQLEAGHVLTAEPGLYFQPNDLTVPAELRGLGIRIEDDVLITGDGATVLSAALPKVPSQIEAWLAS